MSEQVAEQDVEATDEGAEKGNSREARYRVRAREAEVKADALAATVMAYQQREVNRLVAAKVQDVDDFWKVSGVELNDLLDDDGVVSEEVVTSAVDDLLGRKPHLALDEPLSFDGGVRRTIDTPTTSWHGLLRGGR